MGRYHPPKALRLNGAEDGVCLTLAMLRTFDVPAHFVFAYHKTGLLVTEETKYRFSDDELMCWDAACSNISGTNGKIRPGPGAPPFTSAKRAVHACVDAAVMPPACNLAREDLTLNPNMPPRVFC